MVEFYLDNCAFIQQCFLVPSVGIDYIMTHRVFLVTQWLHGDLGFLVDRRARLSFNTQTKCVPRRIWRSLLFCTMHVCVCAYVVLFLLHILVSGWLIRTLVCFLGQGIIRSLAADIHIFVGRWLVRNLLLTYIT